MEIEIENSIKNIKSKGGLKKLKINTLTHCLTFLSEKELFNIIAKTSKILYKALKREYLWKELVLRKELFSQKDDKTTWKAYFLKMLNLEKRWKSGRPNRSFKMFPCRDHKTPITSLCCFNIEFDIIKEGEEDLKGK